MNQTVLLQRPMRLSVVPDPYCDKSSGKSYSLVAEIFVMTTASFYIWGSGTPSRKKNCVHQVCG